MVVGVSHLEGQYGVGFFQIGPTQPTVLHIVRVRVGRVVVRVRVLYGATDRLH